MAKAKTVYKCSYSTKCKYPCYHKKNHEKPESCQTCWGKDCKWFDICVLDVVKNDSQKQKPEPQTPENTQKDLGNMEFVKQVKEIAQRNLIKIKKYTKYPPEHYKGADGIVMENYQNLTQTILHACDIIDRQERRYEITGDLIEQGQDEVKQLESENASLRQQIADLKDQIETHRKVIK